jgi:hypothetical protein
MPCRGPTTMGWCVRWVGVGVVYKVVMGEVGWLRWGP